MLKELYNKRGLMPVWNENEKSWQERKAEIIKLLLEEEYGFLPRTHDNLTWKKETENPNFCGGKVTLTKIKLTAHFGETKYSFPIYTSIPNTEGKHPYFVYISFSKQIPDQYLPIEEICDRGFAVVSFDYQSVTEDYDKQPTGNDCPDILKHILFSGIKKQENHSGKIAMWSWAASRAMDYAQTLDCLDRSRAAVAGHSRLGKTALLTGALDERFACAISNNSGCSGAAISRKKDGETIKRITDVFGYWFCGNYKKYADNEANLPFDQHFLLAAIAPRKVYVASAVEDIWADPNSEFLSCCAANEVYEKLGVKGFVNHGRLPEIGETFHEGNIAYHLRSHGHHLGRTDWNLFMDYMER